MEAELAPVIAGAIFTGAGWLYLEFLKRRLIKARSERAADTPVDPEPRKVPIRIKPARQFGRSDGLRGKAAWTIANVAGDQNKDEKARMRRPYSDVRRPRTIES